MGNLRVYPLILIYPFMTQDLQQVVVLVIFNVLFDKIKIVNRMWIPKIVFGNFARVSNPNVWELLS